MTYLLPSPAGGSSIQNHEKIGYLIQAVLRVVACPFLRTWRALLCGEIMRIGATVDDLQRFFWRFDDPGLKNIQERYGRNTYAVRTAANRWFFTARPALNMSCQDKGMPSRAARGYRS